MQDLHSVLLIGSVSLVWRTDNVTPIPLAVLSVLLVVRYLPRLWFIFKKEADEPSSINRECLEHNNFFGDPRVLLVCSWSAQFFDGLLKGSMPARFLRRSNADDAI